MALLYRDEVYRPESEDRGLLSIIVRKNRIGYIGTCRVFYDAATDRLEDLCKE